MKRLTKSLIGLLTLLLLVVSPMSVSAVSDEEFASNLDYYKNLCFGVINENTRDTCLQFQKYIDRKVEQQKKDVSSLELEIDDLQANILEYVKEIESMEASITALEGEIAANQLEIERMQTNIAELEELIAQRQAEIELIDDGIKERMVSMQSSFYTNKNISFLFGSKDFSEFIRRSSMINSITTFDQEQIDYVTELRLKLEKETEEVTRQKTLVEDTKANNEVQKDTLEVAKRNHEAVVKEFKRQESELLEKQMAAQGAIKLAQSERNSVANGIAEYQRKLAEQGNIDAPNVGVGNGWIHPVSGSFYVSAGSWYYPANFGGGIHYGVDLAASVGTPVVSTGPGIVIVSFNGCPTYGYLGSTCGYNNNWGGNQVITVVQMEDGLYALTYAHLQNASVSTGTIIEKGTVLGTLGSSGNSTGPHLHHEVMYLGQYDLSYYLNSVWNGSINFTPNGAWMNLSWACSNKGAPCRVNPQSHYNYVVGRSY